MRIIQTQQDLDYLHHANLPLPMLKHIEDYFNELRDMFGDTEDTLFSLQKHGYIVILELGDNLNDLSIIGLSREDGGLLGSRPEYVEAIQGEGITFYKIAVMYTNDYLMTFLTIAGWHDDAIDKWLRQEAGIGSWTDELIADKLRTLFDRNEHILKNKTSGSNIWLALASALPITEDTPTNLFPDYALPFTFEGDLFSPTVQPTHIVRAILRTTDPATGTNEYVDGNTFLFRVNESTDHAELLYEEEAFGDAPGFEGGSISDAYLWIHELAKPFYVRLKDPFLSSEQRLRLNGHDQDESLPNLSQQPEVRQKSIKWN
ncbi:hypothetical protein BSK59_05510 [Paenibacillus odorifer]|uniref:hypothetical protein n=1 Tax=Paenibacillus odorifer TaxID=189426 RepID=UPI00096F325D|nr:hypothetical protein [Paenibacillus odorifer]OME60875.1 hypothetical protein BSK59_05510 [Paenibacillus odorifer]